MYLLKNYFISNIVAWHNKGLLLKLPWIAANVEDMQQIYKFQVLCIFVNTNYLLFRYA
jgi:hypothetical protein